MPACTAAILSSSGPSAKQLSLCLICRVMRCSTETVLSPAVPHPISSRWACFGCGMLAGGLGLGSPSAAYTWAGFCRKQRCLQTCAADQLACHLQSQSVLNKDVLDDAVKIEASHIFFQPRYLKCCWSIDRLNGGCRSIISCQQHTPDTVVGRSRAADAAAAAARWARPVHRQRTVESQSIPGMPAAQARPAKDREMLQRSVHNCTACFDCSLANTVIHARAALNSSSSQAEQCCRFGASRCTARQQRGTSLERSFIRCGGCVGCSRKAALCA